MNIEKAFEYDEEFAQKLEALEIKILFDTSKTKRWTSDKFKMTATWSFHIMTKPRQKQVAMIDVDEGGAHAHLTEGRNIFDILRFQAAIEVLTLIADKEKQLNKILGGKNEH